jgi:hypothetical protein
MFMFSRSLITTVAVVIAAVSLWLAYDAHRDPRTLGQKFHYRYTLVSTKADQLNEIIRDGAAASNFLASFTSQYLQENERYLDDKNLSDPVLIQLLKAFSKTDLEKVMQVRLLDSKGYERVRFDTVAYIGLTQITGESLQDKSSRDYFKTSASSAKGLTTTSAIELNVEKGVIEEPYRPTVRFTTPIKINNEYVAHIVLNYDFRTILQQLAMRMPKDSNLVLANKDGSWVSTPDYDHSWNKDLGKINIAGFDRYAPELFKELQFSQPYEVQSANMDGKSLYMKNVRPPSPTMPVIP